MGGGREYLFAARSLGPDDLVLPPILAYM